MTSGSNQVITHPRIHNHEDPIQDDGQMREKEDEEQEDKEITENDYMGLDQETVIKFSSTEKLYTLVNIEQRYFNSCMLCFLM